MADVQAKVRPGDDLVISSRTWNTLLGLIEGGADRRSGDLITGRDAAIVRIKNEAGAALPRHAVVGLGAPIFPPGTTAETDAFLRGVAFRGVLPAAAHVGKFAITLEPAPIDRVVRAYVAGCCPVKVNFVSAGDDAAEAEPGTTARLASTMAGTAQVLWRAGTGTGEQWAIVRLGVVPGDRYAQLPGSAIAGGSTGTVTFFDRAAGGGLTLSSKTATARNDWATATPTSKRCLVGWASGALVIKNWDC